jgi:hypothetical protein
MQCDRVNLPFKKSEARCVTNIDPWRRPAGKQLAADRLLRGKSLHCAGDISFNVLSDARVYALMSIVPPPQSTIMTPSLVYHIVNGKLK